MTQNANILKIQITDICRYKMLSRYFDFFPYILLLLINSQYIVTQNANILKPNLLQQHIQHINYLADYNKYRDEKQYDMCKKTNCSKISENPDRYRDIKID